MSFSNRLFGNFDATSSSKYSLNVTVDGELTGGQSTNHEETSTNTGIAATETKLLCDLDQSASCALTRETLCLVDLGQHSVGRLGNQSSSETSNKTRSQVDHSLGAIGSSVLVNALVDGFSDLLVNDKLGHGVWDLLEQDRTETAVESTKTLGLCDLAETRDEAGSEGGFGDETDTGGLKRAKGNVGKEFGASGGSEVNGGSVVGGRLVAERVDALLLEEFVTSELEGTLQEITCEGRANTGQESACALICNDFSETSNHASVICDGVELDSRLDDIDGSEATVSDGAADSTSKGESAVEPDTGELLRLVGLNSLNRTIELGRPGRGRR